MARVANELDAAKLSDGFKLVKATDEWDYFMVIFDPRVTARARVEEAIKAGGAKILPGPPAELAN